jgi:hypothetical protein
VTACTAIKSNWGVVLYGYFFTSCAAGWSILWAFAFIGAFDKTYTCDANDVCSDPNYGILFGLFVSYFFTHQVLQVSPSQTNQILYQLQYCVSISIGVVNPRGAKSATLLVKTHRYCYTTIAAVF